LSEYVTRPDTRALLLQPIATQHINSANTPDIRRKKKVAKNMIFSCEKLVTSFPRRQGASWRGY